MKRILMAMLLAAGLAAAASPSEAQTATPPTTIKVCIWKPQMLGPEPLLWGQRKGFFAKQKPSIKLEFVPVRGSEGLQSEFMNDRCQIATPQNILWMTSEVVVSRFISTNVYVLVGRRKLTPENLPGASAAVNECRGGSITAAITVAELVHELSGGRVTPYCGSYEDQNNPALKKESGFYLIQSLNTPERVDAVAKGRADFTLFTPPFEGKHLKSGLVEVFTEQKLPDFPSHGIFAKREWQKKNPHLFEAVTRGYLEAARDIVNPANELEVKQALGEWYTGPTGPTGDIERLYKQGLSTWRVREEHPLATLTRMQQWYIKYTTKWSAAEQHAANLKPFDPRERVIDVK